jgi:uncharacterized membrane protein
MRVYLLTPAPARELWICATEDCQGWVPISVDLLLCRRVLHSRAIKHATSTASFVSRLVSKWTSKITAGRSLMVVLAVYMIGFFWLACRRYDACTTQSGDTAVYDHAYYMTLRGKMFWSFSLANSEFEAHAEPLVLLFLPFYYLVQSPKTLLFLQTACFVVASIPVYWLACKQLNNEWGGVFMAMAFLFMPAVAAHNIEQFHTTAYPVPFVMFAFYFFHEGKFRPFVCCLALACLGKEMTAITAVMFLPYALWRRRPWKWPVASLIIPIAALVLSLGVIRRHYAQGHEYIALQYFPGLGHSLGSFTSTLVLHPGKVFDALLTPENAVYLLVLLTPVCLFVPFLVPEVIFVLPELFFNLLSSNNGMKVVSWFYNLNTAVFLVVALVFALPKLDRFLRARLGPGKYGPVLAACVAALCLSTWYQWFSPRDFQFDAAFGARQRAFKLIPPDDSLVAGPGQVLAHLARHVLLADPKTIRVQQDHMFDYNWAFFDMNYQMPILGLYVPQELLLAYGTNTQYQLVFMEKNIFVLRRKQPVPPSQVPEVRYEHD